MSLLSQPSLQMLFRPSSVAVVGASSDLTTLAGRPVRILRLSCNLAIYPVNPTRSSIDTLKAYPRLTALPQVPDVVMVVVGAQHVLSVVQDALEMGVPYVAIYSSGFNEIAAGQALFASLQQLARGSQTRILGPNTEGLIDLQANIPLGFSPVIDPERHAEPLLLGPIAVVSQSGGMGYAILDQAQHQGLGMQAVVSTGNELDLELADFIDYFAVDNSIETIALFLEGLRNPRRFIDAARHAAQNGKRIVAVKVGTSPGGQRAAQSHTGKITGGRDAYQAIFHKAGVTAVQDMDELLDHLIAFYNSGPRRVGKRVAVVSMSGGAGVWLTDQLADAGLTLPQLSPPLQERLRGYLPAYATVTNPIDVTAQGIHLPMTRTIEALLTSNEVDGLIIVGTFGYDRTLIADTHLLHILQSRTMPVTIYSYTQPSGEARKFFTETHVACYTSPARAVRGLAALLSDQHSYEWCHLPPDLHLPSIDTVALQALFAAHGITFNPVTIVQQRIELRSLFEHLDPPFVMKIVAAQPVHKTDIGGVVVGVHTLQEAELHFDRLMARSRESGIICTGVSVERQITGHELVVGALNDPSHGVTPLLMIGRGGVSVELGKDRQYRLPPLTREEAWQSLIQLDMFAQLRDGYRHLPPANLDRLAEFLVSFSEVIARLDPTQWKTIEFNPVIITDQDAVVVDARYIV